MKMLKYPIFTMFILLACGRPYANVYREQIRRITDEEITQYLGAICLELGGHIGLTAIGHCGQCGGMTPCCNMQICGSCAAARGVCPFCLRKVDWTRNTDPEREIPMLLAILERSADVRARQVAVHALTQTNEPQTLDEMMHYSGERMLSMELAVAVGAFKDARYIGFLKKVIHNAGDDYFGDESDIEMQYYLSNAAQAAANSLARIGTKKAVKVLLRSTEKGRLWERYYAISALGSVNEPRVREALTRCLTEFFANDRDWKWIPGRDLIGATLKSLANIGDKETALLVIDYTRDPGCDFLYEELKACLTSIGKPAVFELIAAIREDLNDGRYDWGRFVLVEALGDIGEPRAVPFLIELLEWPYPDQWAERDFKEVTLRALGHLKAHKSLNKIERELFHGKEESTRQAAANALGLIGGVRSFEILEAKLKQQDAQWVERECLASLNKIALEEINADGLKLTAAIITAAKGGAEAAFHLSYQPMVNEEPWAIDFFFANIANVPMQRNFYQVVELLNTGNKSIFTKTAQFLRDLTNLKAVITFSDAVDKKEMFIQTLWNWYQKHYSELE
ncbi:MAG: HEAT repeat domain-containing protein [candidate division WOR-3 bacterium]|nr:MAG: HEAT repeat domain-containing protein [candidate division WOR-3 bacterium]